MSADKLYNLCQLGKRKSFQHTNYVLKKLLIELLAVASAIGAEKVTAKEGQAGAKKSWLPPMDRNPQTAEIKLDEEGREEEPSLLSVTGDPGGGRQAIGVEIKDYSPGVNPIHQQVSGIVTIKE